MSGFLNHFRPSHSRYCVVIEFLLITGAVFCSTLLRFSAHGVFLSKGLPYLPHACLTAFVIQTSMYYADLYNFRVGLSDRQLYLKLLQAVAVVVTVVLIVLFYETIKCQVVRPAVTDTVEDEVQSLVACCRTHLMPS